MNISKKTGLILTLVIAIFLIGSGYFLNQAANNYQVVNKGQILEHTTGYVYQVRFFDKYDIF